MFAHNGTHRRMLAAVLAFAAPAFLLTACNDDPLFEIPPDAPTDVAVAVQGTSATVTWTPGAGATSQEVRMSPLVPVPASAGTALLVEDDRVQTFDDNTTSSAVFENLTEGTSYSTTVTAINGSSRTSSEAQIVVISPPANAPILTTFAIEIDPLGFAVAWTPTATPSENYRVVLTGDDGEDPISDIFPSAATDAFFDAELYPFVEGVTYTAQVFAVNGTEEIGSNTLQLTADFFPWDDYFPTSLHVTGAGKPFYYNTTPNLGFERYTGIPYTDLACQGCHAVDSGFEGPATGKTCDRCHSTTDPQIGDDDVDATLDGACGVCHGRQKAEAGAYSDVHRTAGVDCMFCHTMGDVHGDGTIYRTMIEDGAIDAKCETCHPWDEHQGNNIHGEAVYCTACHAASIVTCNNCHFDSEVNDHVKIFKGPPAMDWLFLLNRTVEGEEYVTVGNYPGIEARIFGSEGAIQVRLVEEFGVIQTIHTATPHAVEFVERQIPERYFAPGAQPDDHWSTAFYGNLVHDFCREILDGGETNQGNFAQSARVQEIINAVTLSHRKRAWVDLPLGEEKEEIEAQTMPW